MLFRSENIEREILELRKEVKRLEREVAFYAKDQFRNKGEM